MSQRADVAIVGGGILGLAHALEASRRGMRVTLVERSARVAGASVRNFGMIWPIGQPAGPMRDLAMRGRECWEMWAAEAGFALEACGSLHLARAADEAAVLEEFAAAEGRPAPLTARQAAEHFPAVRADGLCAALFSPDEACVDPREALVKLPGALAARGAEVRFGETVTAVEVSDSGVRLRTSAGGVVNASRAVICAGSDFETLYPAVHAEAGVRRCKLQMMRTASQPAGFRLGAMVAGGLTLLHYRSFAGCPSLPELRARVGRECPEHVRFGIHVMASQNAAGEVVIGDSHEYGDEVEPWDKPEIDALILSYLAGMVRLPEPAISARWHGVYAKHPTLPVVRAEPERNVHTVFAPGGAGMTLSFGLAEEFWDAL